MILFTKHINIVFNHYISGLLVFLINFGNPLLLFYNLLRLVYKLYLLEENKRLILSSNI